MVHMIHVWYMCGTCVVHVGYMCGTCVVHVWYMWYMCGTCGTCVANFHTRLDYPIIEKAFIFFSFILLIINYNPA